MKNNNNLGKTIKFYQDELCINELINENTFITDAVYSRNYVPGGEIIYSINYSKSRQ